MTRMTSEDNIYKHLSTFMVEMTELRTIMRLSDENSLIIGDEICKGTEDMSAISIVASIVNYLCKKNIKFIFCTHLHKLPEIKEIGELDNLSIKHMKAEYNKELNRIVFHRKLVEGQGDTVYGLEIAKQILEIPLISNMAFEIRSRLDKNVENITNNKKSRYNKRKIVDMCSICKSKDKLHTHHIEPQKNGIVNDKNNLMILCEKCHHEYHENKLNMNIYDIGCNKRQVTIKE